MEYVAQFEDLKQYLYEKHPGADLSVLEKAFKLADEKHVEQKRKSGEPFIIHPVAVATRMLSAQYFGRGCPSIAISISSMDGVILWMEISFMA